jgi:hypothetical protein
MNFSSLANLEAIAFQTFLVVLLVFIAFVVLELFRQSQWTAQSKFWIGTVLGVGCVGFLVKGVLHWTLV